MSKHIFHQSVNGAPHEVQIGWDKPLQQYYANILAIVADDEPLGEDHEECLVWSDCDYGVWPMSLTDIIHEVTRRGFSIPDGLLANVMQDCRDNAVNQYCFYEPPQNINSSPPFTPSPL